MSAPRSRRLRNQSAPVVHTRREITIAAVGSASIVVLTLILIWAMRPGDANSFTEGKGGLIHRQPKMALWLLATIAGVALVAWFVLRKDSKLRRKPILPLLLGITGVVIVSVAVLGVWHNSLVHDYAVPTTLPPTTVPAITTTVPSASTTAASGTATTTPPTTGAPASPSTTGG